MKNKPIYIVLLILSLVALVVGGILLSQYITPRKPTLPEGYNWHHNDEFGYKIGYPESWTVVPQEIMGLGEGMLHAQIFNVNKTDTPSTIMVMVNSKYDISAGAKDVVINGRKGYELITQPSIMGVGMKYKIVAFVVNDKYYVIACFTKADLWDKYAATFDNAINSFVIE